MDLISGPVTVRASLGGRVWGHCTSVFREFGGIALQRVSWLQRLCRLGRTSRDFFRRFTATGCRHSTTTGSSVGCLSPAKMDSRTIGGTAGLTLMILCCPIQVHCPRESRGKAIAQLFIVGEARVATKRTMQSLGRLTPPLSGADTSCRGHWTPVEGVYWVAILLDCPVYQPVAPHHDGALPPTFCPRVRN